MRVAIHQVQYLPYLGYFHKMANCDLFIFLDDVQYKKREFQNRNSIRTKDGTMYLTVPVLTRGRFYQKINEVLINPTSDWANQHLKAIKINYAKAKFYSDYIDEIAAIYQKKFQRLLDVSIEFINFFRKHFAITTPVKFSSQYQITTTSTRRLIDLCKAVGADEYYSGIGGKNYLQEDMFLENNIKLVYQEFHHPTYPQTYPGFIANLSAIDFLMNVGPEGKRYFREN